MPPSEVAAVGTFVYFFYKKTHLQVFCLSQISHLGHQEKCSTWEKNLTELWSVNCHYETLSSAKPIFCFLHLFFPVCHDTERIQVSKFKNNRHPETIPIIVYSYCFRIFICITYVADKIKIINFFHSSYAFLHLSLNTDIFWVCKEIIFNHL